VKKVAAPKAKASQRSAQSAKTESPSDNQYQPKQYVCHRTGSSKNPFVLIYVSSNAVPAHQRHGDVVFPPGTPRETAEAQ